MKLAEALQERADLNQQIRQLRSRLVNNAIVQEDESPAEDPKDLIKELENSVARLEWLASSINLTNCAIQSEGKSLTELLAQKDCLVLKIGIYREFLGEASHMSYRASRTEIKMFSTVDVPTLQKQVDVMSKELRLLDNRIQQINWSTDLIEH